MGVGLHYLQGVVKTSLFITCDVMKSAHLWFFSTSHWAQQRQRVHDTAAPYKSSLGVAAPQSNHSQPVSPSACSPAPFAAVIPKVNPPAAAVGAPAPGALSAKPLGQEPSSFPHCLWGFQCCQGHEGTWKIKPTTVKPWILLTQGTLINSQSITWSLWGRTIQSPLSGR